MFLIRLHKTDLPALLLVGLLALLLGTFSVRAQQGDIAAMRAQLERAAAAQDLLQAEVWAKRIVDASIAQYGPDHNQVGASYYNWAYQLHALARYKESVDAYRRSIAIYERTKGPNDVWVGRAWSNLGISLKGVGKYEEAIAAFHKALAIYKTALPPGHISVANSLNSLANTYNEQAQYDRAFPLWERAMEIYQQLEGPGGPNVGRTINNIGSAYYYQHRFDDALPLLMRALAIYEKTLHPQHPDIARTSYGIATIHLSTGREDEAKPYFRRAMSIWERVGGTEHPDYAHASVLLALADDPRKINEAIERMVAIFDRAYGTNSPQLANSLNGIGIQLRLTKRPREALAPSTRALQIYEKALGPDALDVVRPLWNIVETLIADGRGGEALPFARRAAKILATVSDRGTEPELANPSNSIFGAYSALTQATWAVADKQPSQRSALADEAFSAGQRLVSSSAGAALTQMSQRFGVGNTATAHMVREQQDFLQKRQQVEQALNRERAKAPTERNASEESKLRRELADADSELTALNTRLATEAPRLAELALPKPLAFADVQKLLGPDEALVFFMLEKATDEANSFIWALTRDGHAWGRLPFKGAEWSDRVSRFRAGLDVEMLASKASLDEQGKKRVMFDAAFANQLYSELLGPVESLIKGKRQLLVVPSGALTALPFHLLVTDKPAVVPTYENLAAYRDVAWLMQKQAVTVLPSVGSLKVLRVLANAGRGSKVMVGFGDPVFGAEQAATERRAKRKKLASAATKTRSYGDYWKGAEIDRSKLALTQLPDTADELRAIAKRLGVPDSDIHLGRDASETAVKRLALADYRIVYFATHGLVAGDIKGVGEPSLALTLPAQASELDDGLLTASEVAQLKLNADWVVLSACNTIAGDKPGAEALSGLSRAFFFAGARALLVSHWAVDSAAATKLAITTFDKLAANAQLGRAEALNQAMQDYLNDTSSPLNAYPAMWGAFSVVGNGGQ